MLVTCTCCYDLTKGTQDKDFSYSFSDSLSLPALTITCSGCYDEIKGTQDLKICSHADSQILSLPAINGGVF